MSKSEKYISIGLIKLQEDDIFHTGIYIHEDDLPKIQKFYTAAVNKVHNNFESWIKSDQENGVESIAQIKNRQNLERKQLETSNLAYDQGFFKDNFAPYNENGEKLPNFYFFDTSRDKDQYVLINDQKNVKRVYDDENLNTEILVTKIANKGLPINSPLWEMEQRKIIKGEAKEKANQIVRWNNETHDKVSKKEDEIKKLEEERENNHYLFSSTALNNANNDAETKQNLLTNKNEEDKKIESSQPIVNNKPSYKGTYALLALTIVLAALAGALPFALTAIGAVPVANVVLGGTALLSGVATGRSFYKNHQDFKRQSEPKEIDGNWVNLKTNDSGEIFQKNVDINAKAKSKNKNLPNPDITEQSATNATGNVSYQSNGIDS